MDAKEELEYLTRYNRKIEKNRDNPEIIEACLIKLEKVRVNIQLLSETNVGRTVSGIKKQYGDTDVGVRARNLVNKWKSVVAMEEREREEEEDGNDGEEDDDEPQDPDNENSNESGYEEDEEPSLVISDPPVYIPTVMNPSVNVPENVDRRNTLKHEAPDDKRENHEDNEKPANGKEPSVNGVGEHDHQSDSDRERRHKSKKSRRDRDDHREKSHKHKKSHHHDKEERQTTEEEEQLRRDHRKSAKSEKRDKKERSRGDEVNGHNHHHSESRKEHKSHRSHSDRMRSNSDTGEGEKTRCDISTSDRTNPTKESGSSSNNRHQIPPSSSMSDGGVRVKKERLDDHEQQLAATVKREPQESARVKSEPDMDLGFVKVKSEINSDSSSSSHHQSSEKKKKDRDKDREREKAKERDRDKDKEKKKERERERERERNRDREKKREKEKKSSIPMGDDMFSRAMSGLEGMRPEKSSKKRHRDPDSDSLSRASDEKRPREKSSSSSGSSSKEQTKNGYAGGQLSSSGCSSSGSFSSPSTLSSFKIPSPPHLPIQPPITPSAAFMPEISPNYKPLPRAPIESRHNPQSEEEALDFLIGHKNKNRSAVYSGKKRTRYFDTVPTLFDQCIMVLQSHVEDIDEVGGLNYDVLKPVLETADPKTLMHIEDCNPHLMEDTGELWEKYCGKEFRNKSREEMESWREMYERCTYEREQKLEHLKGKVKKNIQVEKNSLRQTKIAYPDMVAKPPRDVARKQAKYGTGLPVGHAVKAGPSSGGGASVSVKPRLSDPTARPDRPVAIKKAKQPPMMAKVKSMMKGLKGFGRR